MARYLLDSHAFLWIKTDPEQTDPKTLAKLADPTNQLYLSLAGVWELAMKAAMGKLGAFTRLASSPSALVSALRESGIELLPIALPHVLLAAKLPQHHRDPFDRVMIAQAMTEDLDIVTRDSALARYGVRILHI